MSNPATQIEVFRDFAKNELKNHKHALETQYQNRELASNDLVKEGYSKHHQIFEKELTDKMEELLAKDNQFLRPALMDMKERFLEKLKSSASLVNKTQ